MVKQLYDPNMFNYMWESIVPGEDFIVGTYYIEDVVTDGDFIDHLGWRFGAIAFPLEVKVAKRAAGGLAGHT